MPGRVLIVFALLANPVPSIRMKTSLKKKDAHTGAANDSKAEEGVIPDIPAQLPTAMLEKQLASSTLGEQGVIPDIPAQLPTAMLEKQLASSTLGEQDSSGKHMGESFALKVEGESAWQTDLDIQEAVEHLERKPSNKSVVVRVSRGSSYTNAGEAIKDLRRRLDGGEDKAIIPDIAARLPTSLIEGQLAQESRVSSPGETFDLVDDSSRVAGPCDIGDILAALEKIPNAKKLKPIGLRVSSTDIYPSVEEALIKLKERLKKLPQVTKAMIDVENRKFKWKLADAKAFSEILTRLQTVKAMEFYQGEYLKTAVQLVVFAHEIIRYRLYFNELKQAKDLLMSALTPEEAPSIPALGILPGDQLEWSWQTGAQPWSGKWSVDEMIATLSAKKRDSPVFVKVHRADRPIDKPSAEDKINPQYIFDFKTTYAAVEGINSHYAPNQENLQMVTFKTGDTFKWCFLGILALSYSAEANLKETVRGLLGASGTQNVRVRVWNSGGYEVYQFWFENLAKASKLLGGKSEIDGHGQGTIIEQLDAEKAKAGEVTAEGAATR